MTRITISFKKTEQDLLDHLQEQRSASIYIKDLIAADMKKTTKVKSEGKKVKESKEQNDFVW